MSKTDYHVMVYRILSYLYACFMAGERPELSNYDHEALGINRGYWLNIMECLLDEGYIKGASVTRMLGGVSGLKIGDLKITPAGIEYLQENSTLQKAKDFLKDIKDIVPGF